MRIFRSHVPKPEQVLSNSKQMTASRRGVGCMFCINVRHGEAISIEIAEPFVEVFARLQLYNPHGKKFSLALAHTIC